MILFLLYIFQPDATIIVASSWCSIFTYLHWWCTVKHKSSSHFPFVKSAWTNLQPFLECHTNGVLLIKSHKYAAQYSDHCIVQWPLYCHDVHQLRMHLIHVIHGWSYKCVISDLLDVVPPISASDMNALYYGSIHETTVTSSDSTHVCTLTSLVHTACLQSPACISLQLWKYPSSCYTPQLHVSEVTYHFYP
jgi:hypothetical protein